MGASNGSLWSSHEQRRAELGFELVVGSCALGRLLAMLGQEAELGSKHFLPLRGSRASEDHIGNSRGERQKLGGRPMVVG